ncbi:MAG: SpoIIE family protein phosphatase [Planctomycetia bacterium]|nr:SpoIIE family protein phosphatase [Planctomycetia bacterium]
MRSFYSKLSIWFSSCFKTRMHMAFVLLIPILTVNVILLYYYTEKEKENGLNNARAASTAAVIDAASEIHNDVDKIIKEIRYVVSLLEMNVYVSQQIKELIWTDPSIHAITVAYEPDFLKRIKKGEFPEYTVNVSEGAYSEEISDYFQFHAWKNNDEVPEEISKEKDYISANWYVQTKKTKSEIWSDSFKTNDDNDLTISRCSFPFFYKNVFVGVVAIDFDMNILFSEHAVNISRFLTVESGTFLISSTGDLLFGHAQGEMGNHIYSRFANKNRQKNFPFIRSLTSGKTGTLSRKSIDLFPNDPKNGNRIIWFVYSPIESGTDWTLVKCFTEDRVMFVLHQYLFMVWFWSGLTFLLLSFFVVVLMFNIYRPIMAVSAAAQWAADGNLDVSVPLQYELLNNPMGKLSANFNVMINMLKKTLKLKVEEEAKNQLTAAQLETAKDLQFSLIPNIEDLNLESVELYTYYSPVHYVAGDFYDCWKINDDQMYFLIADVCGKGVPAAMLMALARMLIRMASNVESSPGQILEMVNSTIQAINRKKLFVTVFLALFNLRTGELQYCNGGHVYPLIISSKGIVKKLDDNKNLLVGIFDNKTYNTRTINLNEGETILLYTDGITEAASKDGQTFGEAQLIEHCRSFSEKDPEDVIAELIDHLYLYTNNKRQDDITIFALRRLENNR